MWIRFIFFYIFLWKNEDVFFWICIIFSICFYPSWKKTTYTVIAKELTTCYSQWCYYFCFIYPPLGIRHLRLRKNGLKCILITFLYLQKNLLVFPCSIRNCLNFFKKIPFCLPKRLAFRWITLSMILSSFIWSSLICSEITQDFAWNVEFFWITQFFFNKIVNH